MAPPVLLDGRWPPWWSYGCRGCCCGCHGPPEVNKLVVGGTSGRHFMAPCHPLRPHPRPPPHCRIARHSSPQGRVRGSWTGCCQRRDLSTDVQSIQSSEKGSSWDFRPDTRFTGEISLCVCVCVEKKLCVAGLYWQGSYLASKSSAFQSLWPSEVLVWLTVLLQTDWQTVCVFDLVVWRWEFWQRNMFIFKCW